jgi:hypothetical protein
MCVGLWVVQYLSFCCWPSCLTVCPLCHCFCCCGLISPRLASVFLGLLLFVNLVLQWFVGVIAFCTGVLVSGVVYFADWLLLSLVLALLVRGCHYMTLVHWYQLVLVRLGFWLPPVLAPILFVCWLFLLAYTCYLFDWCYCLC